jgi:hypothetical protein
MKSPSERGRKGDTSILIHLVLHKSFSLENNGERDFHPDAQAGPLNVGKSHFSGSESFAGV